MTLSTKLNQRPKTFNGHFHRLLALFVHHQTSLSYIVSCSSEFGMREFIIMEIHTTKLCYQKCSLFPLFFVFKGEGVAKFLPSILTSISKKPPSATSNIKLIFVPCFTLSKKHSSAWASTCKITYNGFFLGYFVCFELSTARN